MNTELANTYFIPSRNTGLGSYELQVIFLSKDQYITLFYVFIFKDTYVINIVDSLSMNS